MLDASAQKIAEKKSMIPQPDARLGLFASRKIGKGEKPGTTGPLFFSNPTKK